MKKYEFILKGLDCPNCARKIQEELEKNKELKNVSVNFAKLKLTYETEKVSEEEVIKTVLSIEPDVEVINNKNFAGKKNSKSLIVQIIRLIIGIIIAILGLILKNTILVILGYSILLYRCFL